MPLADGDIIRIVDQPKDVLQNLVLYSAVLFAAISAMTCFVIGTTRLSKIIVSRGRMITMMQPSILLICFTLVACFAGHADASFGYAQGLCFSKATGENSDNCVSKDIKATVTNYTGPSTCELGSTIIGNITTLVTVTSATRYDVGVYIGLDGAIARTDQRENACLVQTLGVIDANNPLNSNRIGHFEYQGKNSRNDGCLDAKQGQIYGFQIESFKIKCISTDETVTISACFAWDDQAGINCPSPCANDANNQTLHTECLPGGTPVSLSMDSFPTK